MRAFLESHPQAIVIALGEGLQTSYWRLGRPAATWLTVDLAPIIALREQLLPGEEHIITFAGSAFDRAWTNLVPSGSSPIIVAEGLFMYFDQTTVYEFIGACARQFPGGTLVFDAAPRWFARMKVKTIDGKRDASTKQRYVAPPILSAISAKDASALSTYIDGVASSKAVQMPPGRGLQGWLLRAFFQGRLIPARWRMSLYVLRFEATTCDR